MNVRISQTYPFEKIPDDLMENKNRGVRPSFFLGQHRLAEGIFFPTHIT